MVFLWKKLRFFQFGFVLGNFWLNLPQRHKAGGTLAVMLPNETKRNQKVNYYRLHIYTESEDIYQKVSEILNIQPTLFNKENGEKTLWCYGIDEKNEDDYIDFINLYLDILEPKLTKLEEIGIKRSEVSIWRIYEYEHQCAMEITPQEMKRLGNNGITLCIDCFQK